MHKLDWYILKKFLVSFFFCLLLFTVVAVAVDSSEKTDDFMKAKLGTVGIIKQYYLGFVPYIWGLLFPLFVFISVIFFTSRMASRSEIIAILGSGTSYNRFLRPYIVGGVFLGSILWVGNRYLIPKANKIRSDFHAKYIDKDDPMKNRVLTNCYNCFYRRIDTNTYIGIKNYDTANKMAGNFFMERIKDDKVVYNLRSNSIRWDTATRKWKLENAIERTVDSMGERMVMHPTLTINISLKPDELRKDDYIKDKLTTPQLAAYIEREEMRGSEGLSVLKVERYRRSAIAFTVLLLTLIGAVIASRKNRGGSGVHLGLGILIAALFVLSDRFSTVFATNSNLPPVIAAWIPNMAFSLVVYRMYLKTPK
jgi:lipopolysaccharide export system permease protein